jgi:cellulose synthase/poly-beta-1,6-N-acetylglucosamine synthase-like glycosyltransferase
MREFLHISAIVALVYNLMAAAAYVYLTQATWTSLRRQQRVRHFSPKDEAFASPLTPGISIILTAYNESASLVESVRSILALRYPLLEVVVVNDGSTDNTLALMTQEYDLVPVRRALRSTVVSKPVLQVYVSRKQPNVVVVDKVNGRKADAMNAGIQVARHPLIAAVDGDALMTPDALIEVARPFFDDPDVAIASGGTIRILNGSEADFGQVVNVKLSRNWLAASQTVEYFRAFLVGRLPWSDHNALPNVSGAFGLFRRDVVEEVGGYGTHTLGEDMELVLRLHRVYGARGKPYRITFVPEATMWTEGPSDLTSLIRQRRRWHQGLGQCLWLTRDMMFRPRYRGLGMVTLPYYWLFEFFAPLMVVLGVIVIACWAVLGGISWQFLVLYALSFLVGGWLTAAALMLDQSGTEYRLGRRDLARAIAVALLISIGYLQVVQFSQIRGYIDLIRRKQTWGEQRKRGPTAAQPVEPT